MGATSGWQAASRSYPQRLEVPDLVTLAGKERAEALLRLALSLTNVEIEIGVGEETKHLARQVALKRIDTLQTPQWELCYSLDAIERSSRRRLERSLERAVAKDARELVTDGLLDGPILSGSCDPVGGGRDDLEAQTGKYECMAINEGLGDGTVRGYVYDGTINYDKFTYSWQLGRD